MDRTEIDDLLNRYLNGQGSPSEIKKVEDWLNKIELSDADWHQLNDVDREHWLHNVFSAVESATAHNEPQIKTLWPKQNLWRKLAAIAAVLILIFTAYIAWPFLHDKLFSPQLTILKVPDNQRKQVVLDDSSIVTLNSGAEFNYPKIFKGKTREVYLSGEAYFDIRHDASRPFIIHTGGVSTTVLGTAFNIKQNSFDHTVTVTVTRGKVSVANGSQTLGVITPNKQISYSTVNGSHIEKNVDAKQVIAWQESDIYFNDNTFAVAAEKLQQRFKVKIDFANSKLKNCRFTGTALKDESLDNVLKIICAFNNATYQTKRNGDILIDGPGCN